jgi:hypothetical protein
MPPPRREHLPRTHPIRTACTSGLSAVSRGVHRPDLCHWGLAGQPCPAQRGRPPHPCHQVQGYFISRASGALHRPRLRGNLQAAVESALPTAGCPTIGRVFLAKTALNPPCSVRNEVKGRPARPKTAARCGPSSSPTPAPALRRVCPTRARNGHSRLCPCCEGALGRRQCCCPWTVSELP